MHRLVPCVPLGSHGLCLLSHLWILLAHFLGGFLYSEVVPSLVRGTTEICSYSHFSTVGQRLRCNSNYYSVVWCLLKDTKRQFSKSKLPGLAGKTACSVKDNFALGSGFALKKQSTASIINRFPQIERSWKRCCAQACQEWGPVPFHLLFLLPSS